ncbi:hypothetical protein ACIQCM_07260 [Pseudarthrobacter sp. NPDC092439]|uniref:hypothetical protein n=1 Tax=unclassified Pseudarthrobacter TaxID=2647000 RepID=UPI0037F2B06F
MTIESPDSLPEGESQDITATTDAENDGGIPAGAGGVGLGADDTKNTFEPEEVPHGLEKPETD